MGNRLTATIIAWLTAFGSYASIAHPLPVLIDTYGSNGAQPEHFMTPESITVDAADNLYIGDPQLGRITKFNSQGQFLTQWSTDAGFNSRISPRGIEFDPDSNSLYVVGGFDTLFQYSTTGVLIAIWDLPEGTRAKDVAVDANGFVYLADEVSTAFDRVPRIQKYDSAGNFITDWSMDIIPNPTFRSVGGITVTPAGEVLITDTNARHAERFTDTGTHLGNWGSHGHGDGQFNVVQGLDASSTGQVFVADYWNHRIQVFLPDGTYLRQFGTPGFGNGQLSAPVDVAVDSVGSAYVLEQNSTRVQKFDATGNFLFKLGPENDQVPNFYEPTGLAVDARGRIYIADTYHHCIQILSSRGRLEQRWGADNVDGFLNFSYPSDIEIDETGKIYVLDRSGVQVLDPAGNLLFSFGVGATTPGAGALCLSMDSVYINDIRDSRIIKYDREGNELLIWGSMGTGDGQFLAPISLAADSQGRIFVADDQRHCIQAFDASGNHLETRGQEGSLNGQYFQPRALSVDQFDNLYVLEEGNQRIQKFDPQGDHVWTLHFGLEPFEDFTSGNGLALTPNGRILISDDRYQRILEFSPPRLTPLRAGSTLSLQWTANAVNYILEESSNLGASWATSSAEPIRIDSQELVILPSNGPQRFYRLRYIGQE